MAFHKLHILLVGGGHAMLPVVESAKKWRERGHVITLISDHPWLYYSGMVPEYLGGVYREDQVRIDLRKMADKSGISFTESNATELIPGKKTLILENGQSLTYDLAVFNIGTLPPKKTGNNSECVVPSKPMHSIRKLVEFVAHCKDHPGELLIVGGGAAGVEVALNVSGRLNDQIQSGSFSLHLYEQSERLLPDFPTGMSKYVYKLLSERGARIHFQSTFEPRDESTDSKRMIFWATGTRSNSIFGDAGMSVDDSGFMRVHRTLQSIDDPHILGAGDCIAIDDIGPLRKIGVHAVKQGPLLTQNLDALISAMEAGDRTTEKSLANFRPYPVNPLILSTGQADGLWVAGSFWIHGKMMLKLKHYIDRKWIRAYLSNPDEWKSLALLTEAENAKTVNR